MVRVHETEQDFGSVFHAARALEAHHSDDMDSGTHTYSVYQLDSDGDICGSPTMVEVSVTTGGNPGLGFNDQSNDSWTDATAWVAA